MQNRDCVNFFDDSEYRKGKLFNCYWPLINQMNLALSAVGLGKCFQYLTQNSNLVFWNAFGSGSIQRLLRNIHNDGCTGQEAHTLFVYIWQSKEILSTF